MRQLASLESDSAPADRLPPGAFTVGAVLQIAGRALSQVLPADCWICGEVTDYKKDKTGHHYFKLVEGVPGGKPKALDCAIWDSTMPYVQRRLTDAGINIANGQKMLFRGQVKFYDGGGKLTFHVREVKPEYTLGDIEARRREILARLKREGLVEKNKRQILSELPLRICLLSSRNAEGRADFLEVIRKSGYAFDVQGADIPVQGATLATQLCSTLKMLAAKHSILNFDAICIVRGGGSSTDLDWWNNYEICAAIARMPLPVIIGIGHHRDRVAVDEVAYQSLGTPTAAAQFFCDKVQKQDERLRCLRSEISRLAQSAIHAEARTIAERRREIATLATAAVEQETTEATSLRNQLATLATSAIDQEKTEATSLRNQLKTLAMAGIEQEKTEASSVRKQFLAQIASLVRSEKSRFRQQRQALKNARSATLRAAGQVAQVRGLVAAEGRRLLQSQDSRLARHRGDTSQSAERLLGTEATALGLLIQTIRHEPAKQCAAEGRHVQQQVRLLTAYDPVNNLRRGYSITRDATGNVVRSVEAAAAGAEITTQLADGYVRSVVAVPAAPGE
jgi:exodeoxyribonuclease VII large subunit